MNVGILIMTHDGIGKYLLSTAAHMLNTTPAYCELLAADENIDPDDLIEHAQNLVKLLDQGAGVLVLTDMFGATPSNVASKLVQGNVACACVAGINLPMLVRVLNYRELALENLAEKAYSGGRQGVTYCHHACTEPE